MHITIGIEKKFNTFLVVFALILLAGCSSEASRAPFSGGKMSMALEAELTEKRPTEVTDFYSATILSQMYEGLVAIDNESLDIKPQLAKSYTVSTDGLIYEFELREDVYFHPSSVFETDKERLLTVEDVKATFEKACTKNKEDLPPAAYQVVFQKKVKGAEQFYEGKAKTISGLKVEGKKVSIELLQPDANFLYKLANINSVIQSKIVLASDRTDLLIGTGPFQLKSLNNEANPSISLIRNQEYYQVDKDGYQLPYLEELEFVIEPSKIEQLALFDAGEIQFITSLPSSKISEIVEGRIADFNAVPPKLELRNNPMLATNYYFFNMADKRFEDVRVRQAINYAINRSKITQNILNGQYYENGIYGVIPPIKQSFRGYPFEEIKQMGYDYNPEKAKKLFAEAGFPDGKGFGSIDLKVNFGDVNTAVAEEIANQLQQVLGINVNIDGMSFEQKRKEADVLSGDMFRTSWFADYKSPETFLQNFYGKLVPENRNDPSPLNQSRYKNAEFDAYFEEGRSAKKITDQHRAFFLAEMELMKNPPFVILWYNGDNQIIQAKVRNLHENPLNYFIFKSVYIKDWTKDEYLNRVKKN